MFTGSVDPGLPPSEASRPKQPKQKGQSNEKHANNVDCRHAVYGRLGVLKFYVLNFLYL